MSRKIFIDGGANKGQSTEAFLSQWPKSEDFEVYMFEPDVASIKMIKSKSFFNSEKVQLLNRAIWVVNENLTFFVKSPTSEGNTIVKEKVEAQSWKQKSEYQVKAISLSNWIKNNFNLNDYIILKMDIEGAEYDVIKHLDATGTLQFVDVLFLEIHGLKCGKSFEESMDLINIVEKNNLVPYSWGAETFVYSTYKQKVYNNERLKKEYKKWKIRSLGKDNEFKFKAKNKIF